MITRRQFGALAAGAALAPDALAAVPRPSGFIKALFLGLGHNMWCEWAPEGADLKLRERIRPDATLRCRDDLWRDVTGYAASRGVNMLV